MAKRKETDWLDMAAVMRRLGLSRAAIYKAVENGRLRGRKIPVTREVLRIDPASVAAFEVSKSHQKRGRRAAQARRKRAQEVDNYQPKR
jgi:hypothetical protein